MAPRDQMSTSVMWQPGMRWHVVRTHRLEESRAEAGLMAEGVSTFLPRIRRRRRHAPWEGWTEALFPQYLFARFDAGTSLRLVSFARGVQDVVRLGGYLATIDDDAIAMLQLRVGPDGCVRAGDELRSGDRVLIEAGPFASLSGVVERPLTARTRVAILLTSLTRSLRVEVPTDCVRRDDLRSDAVA
jgi:transcription antitermination factor NusG